MLGMQKEGFKSGFATLVGRPNAGKSTLLNAIMGKKIAITSSTAQTTRHRFRAVLTRDDFQLILVDTPGIHKPHSKLGEFMTDSAINTFKEVEVILFLVDEELGRGPGDKYILEMLKEVKTPKILIINKIDKMDPEGFRKIYDEYSKMGIFEDVLGISALEGTHVERLLARIEDFLEPGPMYFPEDMITDHPERFIVSEIIREKILLYLQDEVAVEIESYREEENITRIGAVIYCERKSHKGIIIGKEGKKLKGIGKSARLEIEALLGTKVFLELWVKVKENWRDSDFALSNFGYKDGFDR